MPKSQKKLLSIIFFFLCTTIIYGQSTWNGSTSTDWFTAANWTPAALPTSTSDVIIPSGTPNSPILGALSGSDIDRLTINAGATLTISSQQLTVKGTGAGNAITNNGTLNVGVNGTLSNEGATDDGCLNAGIITNSGTINIGIGVLGSGGSAVIGSEGLYNTGTIINQAGATIGVFGSTEEGIENTSSGNITNDGILTTDFIFADGILNVGTLMNQNGGAIDAGLFFAETYGFPWGVAQDGFQNEGSFTNDATSTVRVSYIVGKGIYNVNGATSFDNQGTITILATTGDGLFNDDDNFINANAVNVTGVVSGVGFKLGNKLTVNIAGTTAKSVTGYGQVDVTGTVDLAGKDLFLTGAYTTTSGNTFTIINNDAADAITGTFNGLAEGATIIFNAVTLYITYVGGDGNDVVLTLVNPLPVELTIFNAKAIDNKSVQLDWQTASEENNAGFEIERSINGRDFKNIGFVEGNGTMIEISNYNFIDNCKDVLVSDVLVSDVLIKRLYYRLKQMDYDGQFEYSNIQEVTIQQSNTAPINIYPNPVQDNLTIENGQGIITVFNTLGQVVRQFDNQLNVLQLNVSDLNKGQYILHIQKANGEIVTRRFVK